jgi:pimeloyl-ACP methyl ester carboxylesterase
MTEPSVASFVSLHDPAVALAALSPTATVPDAGRTARMMMGAMQRFGDLFPGPVSSVAENLFTVPRRYGRPLRERDAYDEAERFFIDTRVGRVRAFRWRQDDMPWAAHRPVVLLMHGWQGRATQLCAMLSPLHALGYDVVGLDAPAHGESSGRSADGLLFSMALRDVADAVAPDGLAAMDGLRVQRLVLLAPPMSVRTVTDDFCSALKLPARAQQALYKRLYERFHPYVWQRVQFHDHAASLGHVPALIVHDLDDHEVPFARGKAVADAWPGATLMATRGLGHRRILRDPLVLGAVSQFMSPQPSN